MAKLAGLPTPRSGTRWPTSPGWTHYVLGVALVLVRHGVIEPPAVEPDGVVRRAHVGRGVVERGARGGHRARARCRRARSAPARLALPGGREPRGRRARAGSWTRSPWPWARRAGSCRSSADPRRCGPRWRCPTASRSSAGRRAPSTTSAACPYRRARAAAFMGKRMVEDRRRTWPWVSALPPAAVADLPDVVEGATFLDRWGDTDDDVTTVDPAETYPVRGGHELRRRGARPGRGTRSGASPRATVDAAAAAGRQPRRLRRDGPRPPRGHARVGRSARPPGVHGARSSGGGAGGTVVVVCDRGALDDVDGLIR